MLTIGVDLKKEVFCCNTFLIVSRPLVIIIFAFSLHFWWIEQRHNYNERYFSISFKTNNMGLAPIFGIAKVLVKSRKLKIAAVGLQLAYLGYKYVKDKQKSKQIKK